MRKILISVLAISCFAVGAPAGAGNTYDPLLDMTSPLYVSPIPSMGGPISALAFSPEAAVTVIVPANQAQTYKFPVHEAPVPKPPPIELEVLTPGCEKLLQYVPDHTEECFEKDLKRVLKFNWDDRIVDTRPEAVSVTFAINSKAEFSEFKLDKSSGNKKIDETALALGATPKGRYPWTFPCRLPPGSPPVVVFRATLHTTPVKESEIYSKGNDDLNTIDNTEAALGSYMADMQRRIKRAWFPPKGYECKRVVVIFKVNRGGALSNLRLDHASGAAIADQAALKAVENAAPFRTLPLGAVDDVDISFTFDYNVFIGGGSCSLLDSGNSGGASEPPKVKHSKLSLKRMLSRTCKTALLIPYYGSGLALLVPSNGGAYSSGDSGMSGGPGFFIPMGGSNNYGGFSGPMPGLFIQ